MLTHRKKGFTLLEIMIVVTIIGVLVAIAIPNFMRLRNSTIAKMIVQEGRQVAGAAQQYLMETSATAAPFEVDPNTGIVTGPLTSYVTKISPRLTYSGGAFTGREDFVFSLSHALGTVSFNMEGKPVSADGEITDDVYNQ